MSQKDRERLQNFAAGGGVSAFTSPGSAPLLTAPSQPDTIRIPRTEPHVAQAALRGFQPFATEPVKQSRYNAYLQSQASQDSVAPLKPAPDQRIDEFNKELEDYAKAALLFKPISGAMAGRFTSAVIFESGPKIHEGLHTPSLEELAEKEKEERKKEEDRISPKEHAARAGMYGPLTRETNPWQPARLLCKRFGVKDPNPPPEMASDAPPAAPSGSDWQQESGVAGPASNLGASTLAVEATGDTSRRHGPRDLENIGLGEDDAQGRDTLTYERPAMDVFKAIFASDDEDSDEEAKKDEDEDEGIGNVSNARPLAQVGKTNEVAIGTSTVDGSVAVSEATVVDMSSFKPTFIPRDKKLKDKDRDKKEKEKSSRRKERKSVLVSFEMEEGGESIAQLKPPRDRPKKKKRKEKEKEKREDSDDEGMWVEKPAPDAVKDLLLPRPTELLATTDEPGATGSGKTRKRAIDFM
jgi:G patch domain-containing protein 1